VFLHRAHGLAGRGLQTSHLRVGFSTSSISTSSALSYFMCLMNGVVGGVDLVVLGGEGLE